MGKDYLPWLRVLDVPSQGKSSRLLGWKTDRVHHLLSSLETSYFYLLEWSDHVTDIREQFPIPIEDSTRIAGQLGIRHPYPPGRQHPMVMTTDFLITADHFTYARTVKPSKELENERTIEKFAIEQRYWQFRNIDWKIVTE